MTTLVTPRELKPRMLVGEGQEEVLFFKALLKHLNLSDVEVEEYGGKEKLKPYLKNLLVRPGFSGMELLGITRDADEDVRSATESLRSTRKEIDFPPTLRIDCFTLPNNHDPGALETLCLESLEGSALTQCVEDYFRCTEASGAIAQQSRSDKDKARIHAWLAAQDPPDLRLGIAASKGMVNWEAKAFDPLKKFIGDLFGGS